MLVALDVDYRADGSAIAAGVLFADWSSGAGERIVIRPGADVRPYRPGRFFERELPCLLAVLDDVTEPLEAIIIDGYAVLGAERRDGLGAHLFRALGARVPVIGVAKTRFAATPPAAGILRGDSRRPLYVTGIGIDEDTARANILAMHGTHRIPTMLAAANRACRGRS